MESGIVDQAISYPYDIPDHSYVFHPTTGLTTAADGWNLDHLSEGLDPVLAIGSNGAPSQLRRKLLGHQEVAIPVIRADLHDHDIVYSAHFSRYGAVPATLAESAGTKVRVFLTFLTLDLLDSMNETERLGRAYRTESIPAELVDINVELRSDPIVYLSEAGPLTFEGQPCALSAIQAHSRRFAESSEFEILHRVAGSFRITIEELVLRSMNDDAFRDEVENWMSGG